MGEGAGRREERENAEGEWRSRKGGVRGRRGVKGREGVRGRGGVKGRRGVTEEEEV